MWEGEMERNPALGAPGSNTYTGLIASSTSQAIGAKASKVQGLSEEAEDELCRQYKPLVLSLAARYGGKGIELDELSAAGQLGLAQALRKFDPSIGVPFGGYAQHWISGQIKALFKPGREALGFGRTLSLNAPVDVKGEDETMEFIDLVVDESVPVIGPDLSDLSEQDRHIAKARSSGVTLAEIGKSLGISGERVRQREVRALSQINGLMASITVVDLVSRGKAIRFPAERTQQWANFRDREPPKHIYCEPKLSREAAHHRANAVRLAGIRGGAPLRNERGPLRPSDPRMGTPVSVASYKDVRRLTRDLRTVAEWREDYDSRLRRAELCFQTIGLSEERRAELVHEGETLKRIYRVLAEEGLT